jgi:phage terminase large subunit
VTRLRIETARVFRPLLEPSRYKGAYGGRGSGESHFFGELMVEECLMAPGTLAVCIREVQKSLMQSSKRLIESKIQQLGAGDQFKILHDRIITPGDGLIIFQGMQDATAESIKSLEGFRIAWVEEAQTLSQRSLSLLRPTIRTEGSQLWANWNPRRKSDPGRTRSFTCRMMVLPTTTFPVSVTSITGLKPVLSVLIRSRTLVQARR